MTATSEILSAKILMQKNCQRIIPDTSRTEALLFPRAELSFISSLARDISEDEAAIYLLLGEVEPGKLKVYVGKSRQIKGRLQRHIQTKSWWDNVIYFLLRNLFHFPPVFRPMSAVSIVFVIAPHPFSICILAVCSGWAPIVSIIHFVSSYWWRGWVLGFPEKCISKSNCPWLQSSINYDIKGNCRSISSMFYLMILYCSGK